MPRAKNTKKNDKNGSSNQPSDILITSEFIAQQTEKDWPNLEPADRAFAEIYCINGYDHRAAAAEIKLNPDRGIHLKRKPLIRAYIAYIQSRVARANIVTKDFIDSKLEELYLMAIGEIDTAHVDTKLAEGFMASKFHGPLALDILRERSKINGIINFDEDEDNDDGSTEIHFHVKDSKSEVKVTRGKSKAPVK